MIKFLKDDVAYGSIIIIAVKDSTKAVRLNDDFVAYMEKLGAGIEGCPVKISQLLLFFIKIYKKLFYKNSSD